MSGAPYRDYNDLAEGFRRRCSERRALEAERQNDLAELNAKPPPDILARSCG